MKQVQRGFTLIELVMVIVILGVLAAVAIPKFVDLKGDAAAAATKGVAGALSSASAINYGARSINSSNTATFAVAASTAGCTAVKDNMQEMPAGYSVSGTAPACTVTNDSTGNTATFSALVIP
jgi:prepilin-type N-terminal cleavage/methylation domain-containing protein